MPFYDTGLVEPKGKEDKTKRPLKGLDIIMTCDRPGSWNRREKTKTATERVGYRN